jgi:hypothetical protein
MERVTIHATTLPVLIAKSPCRYYGFGLEPFDSTSGITGLFPTIIPRLIKLFGWNLLPHHLG